MNRKHFLGIGLLSAAMLLTGCSAEILDGHSGQVPIYLTASVQEGGAQGVTRAGTDVQSTQLPDGEKFHGYFPSGATVSNATFEANGSGGTTADPQPYFTLSGTEATVHAYHGKSDGTEQVKETTTSFSVATDQSSDAAYRASDLMYATATVTKSGLSATGELQFSHKMAKIIVNATMGSGITSITAVKIVGGSKTINIATPQSCTLGSTLLGDNSSANITVFSGTYTDGTLSCAALIPPQRVPAEGSTATNFLQIVTNAGTVTYSLNGKQFDSNNVYTFTVTLTASQVGTTVAITNWADNGNATVTVGGGGALELAPTSLTMTYGDAAKTFQISGSVALNSDGTTAFNVTSSDEGIATATKSGTTVTVTPEGAGDATITVTDANKPENTASCTVSVAKGTPSVTAPAYVGSTLTYNKSAQTLITAGSTTGGTMLYALGNSSAAGNSWLNTLPTGTNAGTYYVWYKVEGGKNYNNVAAAMISGSKAIDKATPTITLSTTSLTIDAANSATFTVSRSGDGTITATSSNNSIATVTNVNQTTGVVTVRKVTDEDATITVTVAPGTNYNAYSGSALTVLVRTTPLVMPEDVLLSTITSTSTGYKGYYIGQNGKVYKSPASATAYNTTAVARITYVGSVPGYFDNFLAIALSNASSSNDTYANLISAANTWASNNAVTVGSTVYNSSTTTGYDAVLSGSDNTASTKVKSSGAEKGWRVPSVTDWKYIFDGIGGKTVDHSAFGSGDITYSTSTTSGSTSGSHRILLDDWVNSSKDVIYNNVYLCSSDRPTTENPDDLTRVWRYNFNNSRFTFSLKTSTRAYAILVFAY